TFGGEAFAGFAVFLPGLAAFVAFALLAVFGRLLRPAASDMSATVTAARSTPSETQREVRRIPRGKATRVPAPTGACCARSILGSSARAFRGARPVWRAAERRRHAAGSAGPHVPARD